MEELDLSSNLISDWGVVIEIIKQLPKLRVLNVSENRLASLKQLKISNTFENVKVLVLNKLGISWEEVKRIKCNRFNKLLGGMCKVFIPLFRRVTFM